MRRVVFLSLSLSLAAGTLRKLPRQLFIERLLLQGYQKMGKTQHLAAFQTVPILPLFLLSILRFSLSLAPYVVGWWLTGCLLA
jgi:ABC-type proline/glycine betaine transport system permease subunit